MNSPKTPTLASTPVIHANDISSQSLVGDVEIGDDLFTVVKIAHKGDAYLVAGGTCNNGLLPSYAVNIEDYCDEQEALEELFADVTEQETTGYPSGNLLAWHGSLCI